MNKIELIHLDAIKRATKGTLYKVQDSLEYPLCYTHAGVTEKIAIEFVNWLWREIPEEAMAQESWEHWWNEWLKTKQ